MQHVLHRLVKRIVGYRRYVPAFAYKRLRRAYHTLYNLQFINPPAAFDRAFYLRTNSDIDSKKHNPYGHFLRYGHREMRNPNADFDVAWYLHNYSHTFDVDEIDPFSHFLKIGKEKGYDPHPPRHVQFNKEMSKSLGQGARRACLFAAYDPDGRVDDYVLIYLADLARHADVFYLADCDMPDSELKKLDGIAKGAWAKRHGAYDFGSYSILARDLVGWETLSQYDEVIFANDSCYLVRPLDETFAQMDQTACAWWGLQASKGLMSTIATQPFPTTDEYLDIDEVKARYLSQFEHDPIYDFHIGSYFMAFRKNVIQDVRFQRLINAIQPESRKLTIILKNEIGITHFLIGHGYEFATFGQTLRKVHPVYTDAVFDLIKDGFPLFKRFMLAENHYRMSSLAYWKVALSQANSLTSIAQIEDNYLRVSNANKLYRNFHILNDGVLPDPPMAHAEFEEYDSVTPTYDHYWGFPVCAFDKNLSDNTRAVFESIKDDPSIVKIIFTRDRYIKLGGVNVICVPLISREGQTYLARCRNLFVKHGAKRNLEWPVVRDLHNIINLWHGIPLKKIGMASLDLVGVREALKVQNAQLRAVIAASDNDRSAMHAAFAPLPIEDIWVTGLPRHDFITKPETDLPAFLNDQLADVREITGGRKLILFCPTFRNDQTAGYYNFTATQVARLTDWLQEHDIVMGIREHLNDKTRQYSSQLVGEHFVPLQAGRFPDIEMLYREAAMLVTDYSSCFIDYMLTQRPAISFAYDLEAYKNRERGLFYELEDVFPGRIAADFEALMSALTRTLADIDEPPSPAYISKQKFFIKHTDSQNAARVIRAVKDVCDGSTLSAEWTVVSTYKKEKSVTFLYSDAFDNLHQQRIAVLASQLGNMGWTCQSVDIETVTVDHLKDSECVVLCALQMAPGLLDLIEGVRATGGKILYDADTLMHDDDAFTRSTYFTADPKRANQRSLQSQRAAQLMMLADGLTVVSSALLSAVQRFGKPAAIVGHCVPQSLRNTYTARPQKPRSNDQIHISYISDTGVHEGSLIECKLALTNLLKARPNVVLHIIGPTHETDLVIESAFMNQVRRHEAMPLTATHELLQTMDINLAPLSNTTFDNARSAQKVVTAALHALPTIASRSEPYRTVITDRETGYLANTCQEWHDALYEAIDNADMRLQIGQAAQKRIVTQFTADVAATQFSDFLRDIQ